MNTDPKNPTNESESNIQSGIPRRTFIKRTTATAVATSLALHSFRNEARAEEDASTSGVFGVYGIVIVIEGPKSGTYTPTITGGNSDEGRGQAILNALAGVPGVTVTKLEGRFDPQPTKTTVTDTSFGETTSNEYAMFSAWRSRRTETRSQVTGNTPAHGGAASR